MIAFKFCSINISSIQQKFFGPNGLLLHEKKRYGFFDQRSLLEKATLMLGQFHYLIFEQDDILVEIASTFYMFFKVGPTFIMIF